MSFLQAHTLSREEKSTVELRRAKSPRKVRRRRSMRQSILTAFNDGNKEKTHFPRCKRLCGFVFKESHTRRVHIKRVLADLYSSGFSFFTVFLFTGASFIILPAVLYRRYPVTRMRNRLSTRGWMQLVVHNRSRAYKRRWKANRQWTAIFRLESYQSLSGYNPTSSATCYLLHARRSPFRCPRPITMGIHRCAIDTRGALASTWAGCVNYCTPVCL